MTHYEPKYPDGIDFHVAVFVAVCFAAVGEMLKVSCVPLVTNILGVSAFLILPFMVVYIDYIAMCERRYFIETQFPPEFWEEPKWRLY
jgi:hypothetical protein